MKNLIFIGLMITLIMSCNSRLASNSATNSSDSITFKSQLIESDNSVPYYQCDDYNAFKIELNTKSLDSLYRGFLKCSKEPIINKQDSTVIDSLYIYSYKNNKIKIYKAVHADLLALYDVTDSIFELNGKIKPGMAKEKFAKKFNIIGLTKDTVDIGNLEHTDVLRFYFKDNVLIRIKNEPYLD